MGGSKNAVMALLLAARAFGMPANAVAVSQKLQTNKYTARMA